MSIILSDYRQNHYQRKPLKEKNQPQKTTETAALVNGMFKSFKIDPKNALQRAALHNKPLFKAKPHESKALTLPQSSKKTLDIDPATIPSKREINKIRQEKKALRARQIDNDRAVKHGYEEESLSLDEAFASLDPVKKEPLIEEESQEAYEELMEGSFMQMIHDEYESYDQDICSDKELLDQADLLALSYLEKHDQ